jgi:hypothetical protein
MHMFDRVSFIAFDDLKKVFTLSIKPEENNDDSKSMKKQTAQKCRRVFFHFLFSRANKNS